MKKVFALLFVIGFLTISCEPETSIEELTNELSIDKNKVCPPNDRDCNPNTPQ